MGGRESFQLFSHWNKNRSSWMVGYGEAMIADLFLLFWVCAIVGKLAWFGYCFVVGKLACKNDVGDIYVTIF